MTKRFCPNCNTLHDGHCSPRALAAAGGKKSGATEPKPKAEPAKAPSAKPVPKPERKRAAPIPRKPAESPTAERLRTEAFLDASAEPVVDWKAKYEALIAGQRKATLERVRKFRAKEKKSKKGKKS
jgi:hypothetical protein